MTWSGSKFQLVRSEGTDPKSRISVVATYEEAGVSIERGEAVVGRIRAAVESTGTTGFGAFAGLHPLDDGRLLAATIDSIGTKPIVARARGKLRNCGADMAAHCINDVITCGADPLVLLDYAAAASVDPEQVAELVEGAAEVCRAAGVALIGGETAEMPDVYREDELDFAATCVGVVERDRLIDGSAVRAGDVVVGFPSAGVHANGFTLVRRVLEEEDYDGDDLLASTRLYLDDVRRLRDRAHAFAHVTGGGILGNLSRVVPEGLRAEIDWDAWERPPVFQWLARHVEEEELRRVFNLGIGFCAVLPEAGDDLVIGTNRLIGVLVSGEGTNLQALIDAGLPVAGVISSRAGARALARAEEAGIETAVFPWRSTRPGRSATRRWRTGSRNGACSWSCAPASCGYSARPSSTATPAASSTRTPRRSRTFPAPIRSRTSSPRARLRRPPPSTTSTRASTPAP